MKLPFSKTVVISFLIGTAVLVGGLTIFGERLVGSYWGDPFVMQVQVHNHSIPEITNLQTVLDGKAPTSTASPSINGLMSSSDKTKMDGLRVIYRIRAQTNAGGVYTWTFPTPFPTGTIPIISTDVENNSVATIASTKITSISNTSTSILVQNVSSVVQVLGINVLSIGASSATFVHLMAIEP